MVSNTPRKGKGAASGWGVSAFSSAVSSAVGGSNPRSAGDDEKDAFVPKTTGDVFAPGCALCVLAAPFDHSA